jgi:hypothetical protein
MVWVWEWVDVCVSVVVLRFVFCVICTSTQSTHHNRVSGEKRFGLSTNMSIALVILYTLALCMAKASKHN